MHVTKDLFFSYNEKSKSGWFLALVQAFKDFRAGILAVLPAFHSQSQDGFHHSKYHIYIHNRKGWERQLRAYIKETEAFLEAHRSLPILFCWLDLHPLALCSCNRSGNLGSGVDVTGFNQS